MKKLKTWGLVFLIIALLEFIGMALIEYYTELLKNEIMLLIFMSFFSILLATSLILFSIYNYKNERKPLAVLLFLIGLATLSGVNFIITIKLLGFI